MWAPSKGIISKMVFWMRTTILQRAFDINTMELGLEFGARLRRQEGERKERSKGMFLTPFLWNAAQSQPLDRFQQTLHQMLRNNLLFCTSKHEYVAPMRHRAQQLNFA